MNPPKVNYLRRNWKDILIFSLLAFNTAMLLMIWILVSNSWFFTSTCSPPDIWCI